MAASLYVAAAVAAIAFALRAQLARVPYHCAADSTCRPWVFSWAHRHCFKGLPANMALHHDRQAVTSTFVRARVGQGRPATILTIGANDLAMDFAEYKYMIEEPSLWRMVFVEPIPWLLQPLRERLREWGVNDSQVSLVNAAVCNTTGSLELFMVPIQAVEELGLTVLHREISHLSSLDRAAILDGIRSSGVVPAALKPELARRVEGTRVRCLGPADLLAEARLPPEELDVLYVDAEGQDVELLRQFLAIGNFRPSLLKFEWVLMGDRWDELMRMVQLLASRGYNIHQDGLDLMGVATTRLMVPLFQWSTSA
mmetsp:Transcript_84984/g.264006  ORF Transcript_84984/g.264006 Transcript_84984/m.264006 type:complete len:312 (+) Transcript_84984:118-1053(+)